MTNSPTLLLTRGAPASGKTTWARNWVALASADDPRIRVNRDDLRWNLFGRYAGLSYQEEQLVTKVQQNAVRAAIEAGVSVVVDDTNLKARWAKDWARLAVELGASFEVKDLPMAMDECISRDRSRVTAGERSVGVKVIRGFFERYPFLHGGNSSWPVLELPSEPSAPAVVPLSFDPSLPSWWVFDLDGTLARRRVEDGTDARGWFDWGRVGEDDDWPAVIAVAKALLTSGERLAFFSGRSDVCWKETASWLVSHLGVDIWRPETEEAWQRKPAFSPASLAAACPLVMRRDGDQRRDSIVKGEMVDRWIRGRYNIAGVFDDRGQVIDELWIPLGARVFDVSNGVRDF